ncbi:MAG TPA: hypothetical protein DCW90_09140 [Lachnospiraceae bacterium]|nr:hypothetical protein [Lachnospiraceae bacterium]
MNHFDIINECCHLQAVNRGFTELLDDSYYSESVDFNLLPKFKTMCERYPELKSYKGLIQQAADLIEDSQTSVTNPKYKKFGYDALKVLVKLVKVLYSVSSVVVIPYCILILPIISYLWDRLIVWGGECAEIGLVRAQLDLYIKQLNKVRKITDDERVDQECKKLIDKLVKKRENLDKTEDELKKSNATVESVCDELKLHIYENVKDEIERNSMLELLEESTDIESFKENAIEIIEYMKESGLSDTLYGATAVLTIHKY